MGHFQSQPVRHYQRGTWLHGSVVRDFKPDHHDVQHIRLIFIDVHHISIICWLIGASLSSQTGTLAADRGHLQCVHERLSLGSSHYSYVVFHLMTNSSLRGFTMDTSLDGVIILLVCYYLKERTSLKERITWGAFLAFIWE